MDRVIFRKFRDGQVIAWLPDVEANPGRCMSYMHIGQHSEGVYPADTVPASEIEYTPLWRELFRLGYRLRVVQRMPHTRNMQLTG
ncbi:MAG: hypothetical protein NUV51_10945 [Sulfuricaulis sp.]|nr:hypothetical protein [Sulfuricaulis sp.]